MTPEIGFGIGESATTGVLTREEFEKAVSGTRFAQGPRGHRHIVSADAARRGWGRCVECLQLVGSVPPSEWREESRMWRCAMGDRLAAFPIEACEVAA